MKKRFFLLLAWVFMAFGISMLSFLVLEDTYNLSIERTVAHDANLSWSDNVYTIHTMSPKNIWYVGLPKHLLESESDFQNTCVHWTIHDSTFTECLDDDGDDMTDEFYSFPVGSYVAQEAQFWIESPVSFDAHDITVYSLNTLPSGKKLSFRVPGMHANSNIISRAEWGADESLRYWDSAKQQTKYKAFLAYAARAKTEQEIATIKKNQEIHNFLVAEGGDTAVTMSLERYENGRLLVWPIQRVKKVDRIVVHHTADSLDKHYDDKAMIRAIYAYHAVSRGWGDIGYNYLIGQRGAIYEWRAGGDYVVGAHALYNNMGTVGISVLGDYNTLHLNADQRRGLETAIMMMAEKYGITLSDTKTGWKKCSKATCGLLEKVTTKSLIGHKDVGVTSCPGTNIYSELSSMIARLDRQYEPVLNTVSGRIDPRPENEVVNVTTREVATIVAPTETPALVRPQNETPIVPVAQAASQNTITPTQYFGKKFRVRLSYPETQNSITLSSFDKTRAIAFLDFTRRAVFSEVSIVPVEADKLSVTIGPINYTVSQFSFSAPVVSVDSWTRIPAWDTKFQYNDNLFRDTIEIYNENGKLVVVNSLPLEWYLKGLGEVSNGDLPEKIKTITVAARTYAVHYMDKENRKYNTHKYDGSDDPDSFQKYIGYSYELRSPNVARMVDATAGEVIRYQGNIIKPWYFSSSDGRTLSALEYCQNRGGTQCEDIPYLQSVADPGGVGKARSGHGVGISGIGSTYFAGQGWDYKKIITYYLQGVEIGQ